MDALSDFAASRTPHTRSHNNTGNIAASEVEFSVAQEKELGLSFAQRVDVQTEDEGVVVGGMHRSCPVAKTQLEHCFN